jgi:hypothetical protein
MVPSMKGEPMRAILRFALLIVVLGVPGVAVADEQQMSRKPTNQVALTATTPWYREAPHGEACWGDSREKDEDLNDGARISTEDILRIINPAQS